jgi:dTDP-glucose 4,6-dehydratase
MLSGERYPVNLGNPTEMTILEFAQHIRRMTGTASAIVFEPLPEDDPKRRKPDITKARAVLGWSRAFHSKTACATPWSISEAFTPRWHSFHG